MIIINLLVAQRPKASSTVYRYSTEMRKECDIRGNNSMIIILCNENKVNEIYDTVYDIRLQKLLAQTKKKPTYNGKSIKVTYLIRF